MILRAEAGVMYAESRVRDCLHEVNIGKHSAWREGRSRYSLSTCTAAAGPIAAAVRTPRQGSLPWPAQLSFTPSPREDDAHLDRPDEPRRSKRYANIYVMLKRVV